MNASQVEQLLNEILPEIRRTHQATASRLGQRIDTLTADIGALRRTAKLRMQESMRSTLQQLDAAVVERQQRHAALSPNLNCWEVLGLQDSELVHSRVLAWLLDRRQSHAQGPLFFRQLLGVISNEVLLPADCAEEPYRVETEVRHARSRIDIEIIGPTFILHIETKVNAEEGDDQTCREREDLKAKANARGISLDRAWGLYLSLDGAQCADDEKFHPISWMKIVAAVDASAKTVAKSQPRNVYLPWVLSAYANVLRLHVVRTKSRVVYTEGD